MKRARRMLVIGTPDYALRLDGRRSSRSCLLQPGGYKDEHITHYRGLAEILSSVTGSLNEDTAYILRAHHAFRKPEERREPRGNPCAPFRPETAPPENIVHSRRPRTLFSGRDARGQVFFGMA